MKTDRILRLALRLVLVAIMSGVSTHRVWADPSQSAIMNITGDLTNFNGAGVKIGQEELWVPTNHVDLGANPITTTVFPGAVFSSNGANHATEVAGVMVSTNALTKGIAFGASLFSDAVGSGGPTGDVAAAYYLATNNGAKIINMSFGIPSYNFNTGLRQTNATGNSFWEQGLDSLAQHYGVTLVQAAGNDGRNGTNTIVVPAGAYNMITVGSVTNGLPTSVSVFSSTGYLIDGRSAPDIVAPGGQVLMPGYTTGAGATQTVQKLANGTSFAAPAVAALVADLSQAGAAKIGTIANGSAYKDNSVQDPLVLKAILMNSATPLAGWSQVGTTTNNGLITVVHPLDPNQGAGLANGAAAYNQYINAGSKDLVTYVGGRFSNGSSTNSPVNGQLAPVGWNLSTATFGLTNFYQESMMSTGTISITLDWDREISDDGTNFAVLRLADLNLLLWRSPDNAYTSLTLVAQSVSPVDNIQHLYLNNTVAGYYEIGVNYLNNSIPGVYSNTNLFQAETYGIAYSFSPVPEPSALLLTSSGLIALWQWRLRRVRRRKHPPEDET